mmetsp:Transcript_5810/g.12232  ORF Transcript_5810/g.12232 Transcript_5810/m.12232 type:complete len:106 (+) Transcript_5810:26-343(+)
MMPMALAAETDTMPTSGKYADVPVGVLLRCGAIEMVCVAVVVSEAADADTSIDARRYLLGLDVVVVAAVPARTVAALLSLVVRLAFFSPGARSLNPSSGHGNEAA